MQKQTKQDVYIALQIQIDAAYIPILCQNKWICDINDNQNGKNIACKNGLV